tara:strand:- start:724 stop:1458 length:735 start_codon:yes stop_codon:yes gene_type:complete
VKPNLHLGDSQLILKECKLAGLLRNQAAYVLATAWWETAHTIEPVKEAYWVNNAEDWRKKNLRYYPWYGRGYVQLTWQRNYAHAGEELNLDLTTNPDAVMRPEVSAKILVTGSLEGWFTGRKLGDYITLQKSDFKGARRVINGTDKAAKIAVVAKAYDAALKAEGYGAAGPTPTAPKARTHPAKSKTVQASIVQGASAVGGAVGAVQALDGTAQIIAMVGCIVVALTAIFILRERLKSWAAGWE